MVVLYVLNAANRASALALLVARIGADHTNHTLAADDLAVAAHFLDRCRDFHRLLLDLFNALGRALTRFTLPGKRSAPDSNHMATTQRQPLTLGDSDVAHPHPTS